MRSLETAQAWILRGIVLLLPLFFLPITSDFYDFNKLSLLVVGVGVGLLLWAARQYSEGVFKIRTSPTDLPVFVFAVVVLISAALQTPNKTEAFAFPGTATLVVSLTLLYFLVIQESKSLEDAKTKFLTPLLAGTGLSAFITILATIGFFGFLGKFLALPFWLSQPTFSPTGGLLPGITLFIALLPLVWGKVLAKSEGGEGLISITLLTLLVGGILAAGFHSLPGKTTSPQLLSVSTGWSIALETLKREPLLGVGPGNFLEVFNRFRPVEYNFSPVWNLRFGASSNWYLHAFTVAGLLGVVAFLWVLWRIWKAILSTRVGRDVYLHSSLVLTLILLALVPGNFLLLLAFYLLLAASASGHASEMALQLAAWGGVQHEQRGNLLSGFVAFLALLILAVVLWFGGRVYAAEMSFRNALDAINRNEGVLAYNNLREAIRRNPSVDRYRITNSQVNIAIASAIASKTQNGQELTEQERNNISQLVGQSVDEAKAAVALNPQRSTNWANLAQIYRALMAFAQGADQWAIASYRQAIALEPINPILRIELGGVYYALAQYEDATRVFEIAVAAKPDLANAHYNLAVALREDGKLNRAAQEMAQTLALVEQGSEDYELARRELEALQTRIQEEATAAAEVRAGEGEQLPLEAPQPAPEPVVRPPLELPEKAAPPATPSGE